MKKIYAVWAKVKLIKKPNWLDSYRKKYNNLYEFHVTLKQPCFIDNSRLEDIKSKTSKVINQINLPNHKINVVFENIKADRDDKSIMIMAEKDEKLIELQSKIRSALSAYKNYIEPALEEYENNFQPHLTITGDVGDKFDEALNDVERDTKCVGEINEIILSCVKENTLEEAKNPKNLTIYQL